MGFYIPLLWFYFSTYNCYQLLYNLSIILWGYFSISVLYNILYPVLFLVIALFLYLMSSLISGYNIFITSYTLWLFNIAMEAMAHRNRWFTYE